MNKHPQHSAQPARFWSGLSVPALLCLAMLVLPTQKAITSPAEAAICSAALGQPTRVEGPGLVGPIRLLSWNIQKSQNQGWVTDLLEIGTDRDLLLIQEASTQAMISSTLPQALYLAFAAGYTTRSETTGVLTLSSVEPSLQCNLTAWEPWLGTPKATNITEYKLAESEERLLVVNLHAVNFSVGMEDFAAQIDALSPLLNSHQGPLLVAGDFNTWSTSRHSHLASFMATHQLAAVDFSPDHRTRFWDKPLDHMYLRGLKALKAKVVPVASSDHNPLLVTLEIE
ncbi:MAG: endonuclease/exonuclease/phosphatase family protein [Halioglobus sp.]